MDDPVCRLLYETTGQTYAYINGLVKERVEGEEPLKKTKKEIMESINTEELLGANLMILLQMCDEVEELYECVSAVQGDEILLFADAVLAKVSFVTEQLTSSMAAKNAQLEHATNKLAAQKITNKKNLDDIKDADDIYGLSQGTGLFSMSESESDTRKEHFLALMDEHGISRDLLDIAVAVVALNTAGMNNILGAPAKIGSRASSISKAIFHANKILRGLTNNIVFIQGVNGELPAGLFFGACTAQAVAPELFTPLFRTPLTDELLAFYIGHGVTDMLNIEDAHLDQNALRFLEGRDMLPKAFLTFNGSIRRNLKGEHAEALSEAATAIKKSLQKGSFIIGGHTLIWDARADMRSPVVLTWIKGEEGVKVITAKEALAMGVPVLARLPFTHDQQNFLLPAAELISLDAAEGFLSFGPNGYILSPVQQNSTAVTATHAHFIVGGMRIGNGQVQAKVDPHYIAAAYIAVLTKTQDELIKKVNNGKQTVLSARPADRIERIESLKKTVAERNEIGRKLRLVKAVDVGSALFNTDVVLAQIMQSTGDQDEIEVEVEVSGSPDLGSDQDVNDSDEDEKPFFQGGDNLGNSDIPDLSGDSPFVGLHAKKDGVKMHEMD